MGKEVSTEDNQNTKKMKEGKATRNPSERKFE